MKNLKRILYNVFLLIGFIIFVFSLNLPIISVFVIEPQEYKPISYQIMLFSVPFFIMALLWMFLSFNDNKKEKEMKCRKCGSVIYEHYKPEHYGGDEEFWYECPKCGELDPTDLLDECIDCGKKLKKNDYMKCKACEPKNDK